MTHTWEKQPRGATITIILGDDGSIVSIEKQERFSILCDGKRVTGQHETARLAAADLELALPDTAALLAQIAELKAATKQKTAL